MFIIAGNRGPKIRRPASVINLSYIKGQLRSNVILDSEPQGQSSH